MESYGIDYEEWSPETDKYLPANYTSDSLAEKLRCKAALQKAFSLPVNPNIPLIASISRLADQKGFDLVASALNEMLGLDVQYVLLGTGERKYNELFPELAKNHRNSFSIKIAYDNALAHLIEAGADMFLMPSLYEPCGLNQLYSLRYGTVPIVRAVGGLDDTITDDPGNPAANTGFKFYDYTAEAMLEAIKRARKAYDNRTSWLSLVKRCMQQDFSWEASARAYSDLYEEAVQKHGLR
jgi:starch synthase